MCINKGNRSLPFSIVDYAKTNRVKSAKTHQVGEENNGAIETMNCNKNIFNIHRKGLYDNNCNIPGIVQDILKTRHHTT